MNASNYLAALQRIADEPCDHGAAAFCPRELARSVLRQATGQDCTAAEPAPWRGSVADGMTREELVACCDQQVRDVADWLIGYRGVTEKVQP